jgi:hypothetical protein
MLAYPFTLKVADLLTFDNVPSQTADPILNGLGITIPLKNFLDNSKRL